MGEEALRGLRFGPGTNPLFLDFSQDSHKPLRQRSRSVLDRELFLQIKSYMEIKHNTDKNQVGLKLMGGVGKGKREVISELPLCLPNGPQDSQTPHGA